MSRKPHAPFSRHARSDQLSEDRRGKKRPKNAKQRPYETRKITAERVEEINQRTRDGGAEIVKYLEKGSAFYAPAAAGVEMAAAYLKDVTLYEIARLFKNAMDNMPVIHPYELHREQVHLGEQKALISRSFDIDGCLRFSALIKKLKTKLEIVVTFLAVLELVRMRQIIVIQNDLFGEMEMQRLMAEA